MTTPARAGGEALVSGALTSNVAYAAERCRCGCTRSGHRIVHGLGGCRYTACSTRHRPACDQFTRAGDADTEAAAPLAGVGDEPLPDDPVGDAASVVSSWNAWQCLGCGSRYGFPLVEHGAPRPCDGRLIPVTVTITRRADG